MEENETTASDNTLEKENQKKHLIDMMSTDAEYGMYDICQCGNPSGMGNVHFEGLEELIYICSDCGKRVLADLSKK